MTNNELPVTGNQGAGDEQDNRHSWWDGPGGHHISF
jgi:hypothetical protein